MVVARSLQTGEGIVGEENTLSGEALRNVLRRTPRRWNKDNRYCRQGSNDQQLDLLQSVTGHGQMSWKRIAAAA
jgi:hypothetical protein